MAQLLLAAGLNAVIGRARLGMELIDDVAIALGIDAPRGPGHMLSTTIEEGLEMLGVALYLYAVADQIAAALGGLHVSFLRGGVEVLLTPPPRTSPRDPGPP